MINYLPWEKNFYDPALFEAGAGDRDDSATLECYLAEIGGKPCRILDIGCGTGRFALQCVARTVNSVLGLDSSAEMLAVLAEKRMVLSPQHRRRLNYRQGDILQVHPQSDEPFDFVVAMDDFTTHFHNLESLGEFFHRASMWLSGDGLILTDLRVRDDERLALSAGSGAKSVKTFGIVPGVRHRAGKKHVAMRFWEEYETSSRLLVSHQIYDYIDAEGCVKQTVYRTIRQRLHTCDELKRAAEEFGFHMQSFSRSGGQSHSSHRFFRFNRA